MHSSSRESAENTRDVVAARALPGVGDVGFVRALANGQSAGDLLAAATPSERDTAQRAAHDTLIAADRIGADVLVVTDERYPARLRDLADAPAVLFAKGAIPIAEPPAVAIVGTRGASNYGLRVARAIASTCARAGVSVISGLAQGIDGAAHEAALEAGGRTVGVLGTGLDFTFPRRHRALQERVAREGLLLSELSPGVPGHAGAFPRRNRIIAALADVTVVVEAGEGSGALITADFAHALHRHVACVPNAIDIPSSAGSNALLKSGAEPILSPDDVLSLLSLKAQPTPLPLLDDDAAACWHAIVNGALDVVAIARATNLSVRVASTALTALELEGLVVVEASGSVRRDVRVVDTNASDRAVANA